MSTERDIERILDAWLAPGPNEMPDRLYHDAIDRIERTPQRRAAWPRRFPTMFSMSKLPLAAAVAALAIGLATVGLWQGRDGPGPADQAPAATTPSSSPSPDAGSFVDGAPEALRGSWSAAPRGDIPGLFLSKSIASWAIDSSFHTNFQDSSLGSRVITTGPDTFRLENVFGGQGCPQGSVGDYAWTLGDHGTSVTIGVLSDDCAARADYLDGAWSRTSCDLGWSCLGRLEPGRHESAIFDPRAASEPRVARPGAVSYEVPEGWANADDWHHSLMLVPDSGFQRLLQDPNVWPDQVRIWSTPVTAITLEGSACEWRVDPEGGRTVESLAAWLSSHPDLMATSATPISIDGHEGLVVDIDLAIDESTACPAPFEDSDGVKVPGVPILGDLTSGTPDGRHLADWDSGGWDFGPGGICADCLSDPQRIILLDLDGQPLVILVDSEKPEDQAAFVERAMPIIESLRFPE